jgi:hypothetical protein
MEGQRKRTFDALFKPLLRSPGFGKMSPREALRAIRFSPAFWAWWGTQFWMACRQSGACDGQTGLFERLQFNQALIPGFILKQIFDGKQKPARNQAAGRKAANAPYGAAGKTGATGRCVESGV